MKKWYVKAISKHNGHEISFDRDTHAEALMLLGCIIQDLVDREIDTKKPYVSGGVKITINHK